jgi:hypothetical protein
MLGVCGLDYVALAGAEGIAYRLDGWGAMRPLMPIVGGCLLIAVAVAALVQTLA